MSTTLIPSAAAVCFIGLACAASLGAALPAPNPATLRVMSFNVRTSSAQDGENGWGFRRELFFREIERFAPDLIGFQEVRADQHDAIVERMKAYGFVGVARDDGQRRGEWSLAGFRRERFENLGAGDFWLSETPEVPGSKSWDAALTRICTWVRLRDRQTSRALLFANTHFDHKGVISREHASRLLVTKLTELAQGRPVVLAGDFNINEDTAAYAVLTQPRGASGGAWLIDAYRAVHPQRSPEEATFHGFKGTRIGSRIDFVFHSPELKALSATIERGMSPEGLYPSDHYAVTAVLAFEQPAAAAQ
jgi:endonuclease/exonuclease/phosphatase family metal-dependent hydrolase